MEKKQPLIAFSDLTRILKKNSVRILVAGFLCFTLALAYMLTRPITYKAIALFRDKKKSESSISEGAKLLLYKENDSQSESIVLFESRQLLESVIRKLGLQGSVKRVDQTEYDYLSKIRNNLAAEIAYWGKPLEAVILQQRPALHTQSVLYTAEQPLKLDIHFFTPNDFTVTIHENQQLLGPGKIGQPYHHADWQFTLVYPGQQSLEGHDYLLKIVPMPIVVKKAKKKLRVSVTAKDSGLLTLTYKAEDRDEAALFLNTLMAGYKQRIVDERNRLAKAQVDYLAQRQHVVANQLQALMDQHASSITNDLFATGLFDLQQEIDALAKQQLACKQKVSDIHLQLQRLDHIQEDGPLGFCHTTHGLSGDHIADAGLKQLRDLKHHRDILKLALQQSGNSEDLHDDPQTSKEFDGINLETANDLYLEYSKNLDNVQRNIREQQFIMTQLDDPHFEINSLSIWPTDPATQSVVTKSMELALALKDENNRSLREQERIKESLTHQKSFIISHLKQSLDLLEVNEKFVKEKLQSLQKTMVGLIDQELFVTEKHLADYFATQAINLQQEHALIENQLQGLQKTMVGLPNKWVTEQTVQLHVDANKELMKEVTKLAENKTITKNLEVVQSNPVDIAIPPFQPEGPFVFLISIVAGCLGLFLASISALFSAVIKGIPASQRTLNEVSEYVAGHVTVPNNHLDTLRRLSTFLFSHSSFSPKRTVLAILSNGPDYIPNLAELLHKKGKKTVVMSVDFTTTPVPNALPGLLQVLEGSAKNPHVTPLDNYAYIASGGISLYGAEMLASAKFHELTEKLLENYDLLIAVTHTLPTNSATQNLIKQFDAVFVSVNEETHAQLQPYMQVENNEFTEKHAAFIFYS